MFNQTSYKIAARIDAVKWLWNHEVSYNAEPISVEDFFAALESDLYALAEEAKQTEGSESLRYRMATAALTCVEDIRKRVTTLLDQGPKLRQIPNDPFGDLDSLVNYMTAYKKETQESEPSLVALNIGLALESLEDLNKERRQKEFHLRRSYAVQPYIDTIFLTICNRPLSPKARDTIARDLIDTLRHAAYDFETDEGRSICPEGIGQHNQTWLERLEIIHPSLCSRFVRATQDVLSKQKIELSTEECKTLRKAFDSLLANNTLPKRKRISNV